MALLVGFDLVDPGGSERRVSDAAGAGYGLGYAAMDNVLDVLVETGAVILAGAAEHQILDAANVAAVVSRDGGDARRELVSTTHRCFNIIRDESGVCSSCLRKDDVPEQLQRAKVAWCTSANRDSKHACCPWASGGLSPRQRWDSDQMKVSVADMKGMCKCFF